MKPEQAAVENFYTSLTDIEDIYLGLDSLSVDQRDYTYVRGIEHLGKLANLPLSPAELLIFAFNAMLSIDRLSYTPEQEVEKKQRNLLQAVRVSNQLDIPPELYDDYREANRYAGEKFGKLLKAHFSEGLPLSTSDMQALTTSILETRDRIKEVIGIEIFKKMNLASYMGINAAVEGLISRTT